MSVTLPNVDSFKTDLPLTISSTSSLKSAGVLIVDEDPAFQLGLKTFLKDHVGFREVFTAKSGAEALVVLENEKSIELVTLDYRMPGMNGIEVLRRLNANPPHPLSVVMITGYPSDQLEEEFRNLGTANIHTTHFLTKPVELEDLESLLLSSHDELKASERLAAAMAEETAKKAAEKAAAEETEKAEKAAPTSNGSGNRNLENVFTGPQSSAFVNRTTGVLHDPTGPISPIAAAALFAQRDPTEPVPFIETSNPELSNQLDEMNDKMAHLENEVSRMAARTPSIMERFWLDILKIMLLAAVAFVLFQFGVHQKTGDFLMPEKPAATAVSTVTTPDKGNELPMIPEKGAQAPDSEAVVDPVVPPVLDKPTVVEPEPVETAPEPTGELALSDA